MKLNEINDYKSLKNRIIRGLHSGGLFGIAKEFNCDLKTAHRYSNMLSGGTYGEADIKDKLLHRIRAPQNILAMMKYYKIPSNIISKLIRLHIDNRKTISKHMPSPDDEVAIKQLINGERLVASISDTNRPNNKEFISVPQVGGELIYISRPEDEDIINELNNPNNDLLKMQLLAGLAYGYPMADVFNYIRSQNPQLIDKICGHVDKMTS